MRVLTVSLVTCLVAAAACSESGSRSSSSSLPTSPSTVAAPPAGAAAAPGRQDVRVNMLDACDPTTFDAAIGAGTCVRNGGVTFDQFIAMLTRLGFAGAWHFSPPQSHVVVGQSFEALNKGGEVHTFTEVAEFGGGIVPVLNQLAHVPQVAPECTALEPEDFVAPGATYHESVDHAGALKFQCCIHPWMRLEATAASR